MNWTNGFIINDLVVWKDLDRSGRVTKGFVIEPQDLRNSKIEYINRFGYQLSKFLTNFQPPARIQIKWGVSSDYSDMLNHYSDTTDNYKPSEDNNFSEWTYQNRKEILGRYRERMEQGFLRREKLMIFISYPIKTQYSRAEMKKSSKRKIIQQALLRQFKSTFDIEAEKIKYMLGAGVVIKGMTSDDLKVCMYKYFNRSALTYSNNQIVEDYDDAFGLLENCVSSEYVGVPRTHDDNYTIFGDHYFQDVAVITQFPDQYTSAFTHYLSSLDALNYEITVNIVPEDARAKIRQEERIVKAMSNQQRETEEIGVSHDIEAKAQKILKLKSGNLKPFKFEYYITAWDSNKEALTAKMQNIGAALMQMGATYYSPTLPNQALNMLTQTMPGNPWGEYNGFAIDGDSDHARLLPISSTFTGWTDCDAIYDGENMNLIGVKQFLTTSQPQHCVVFGSVGSGKSALMINLLTQTECIYDYTVIIEEGASYPGYAALEGQKPIILSPNSQLTINYFDTNGLPLTPEHKGDAIGLLSMMCGESIDPEYQKLRGSMILHYLDACYEASYEVWASSNRDVLEDVVKYVISSKKFVHTCPPDYALRDVFLEFRECLKDSSNEKHGLAKEIWNDLNREVITKYLTDPSNKKEMMEFSFAWFEADDFPQHNELIDSMYNDPHYMHDKETVSRIATLLSAYCDGGAYGCVFDGASNVDLKAKLVYFDLAPIGQSAKDLKAIVAFLITNHVRNYIMTMPRKLKKRMIFEEMARFKDIPGADKLIEEAYSQMRKYGLWVCSLLQNYGQIKDHKFSSIVLGNASQYFICQQKQMKDVRDLGDRENGIDLPEETMESITRFVNPSALPASNRYSSFAYVHNAQFPMIGVARNYCSKEMLYVSSISGETYEQSMREIFSMDSPFEAVVHYANQK